MRNAPSANANVTFCLYYLFKILPICAGTFFTYLGYKLFILGVTGQASLSVESKKVSAQLLNAAPGLFFAIGGILAVIITVWKGVDIAFHVPRGRGAERGIAFNSLPDDAPRRN